MIRSVRIALLVALTGAFLPVYPVEFTMLGSIAGVVRSRGTTQMGASVLLLNRNDRVILRSLTDGDGRFRFPSLPPDQYSVRVMLSSFIPAGRNLISVRPGVESFLNIQLANLFSSIELVYLTAPQASMLTEEWKWTLRSANEIRPVLRLLPEVKATAGNRPSRWSPGPTRGMVAVSAGEGSSLTPLGMAPDLGTAFAVATSVFGSRELTVSGNLGYDSQAGTPTAGFSTRLAAGESSVAPDVELTVRQASVRQVSGNSLLTGTGEAPVLRTMSVKLADKTAITRRNLDRIRGTIGSRRLY